MADAIIESQTLGAQQRVCLPKDVVAGQLTDNVTFYLRDHPAKRQLAAVDLVLTALREAYPCGEKGMRTNVMGSAVRVIWSALGAIALALLGVMLTMSFNDAKANGASYFHALGIDKIPEFFQSSLASLLVAICLTAFISVLGTRWWTNRTSPNDIASKPSDYRLSEKMEFLVGRMRQHLEYDGFSLSGESPNEILMDCNSFCLTLRKLGFVTPFVPSGNARPMFAVFAEFFGQVGPLLRDGHGTEARQIGAEIAKRYPAPGAA